MTAGNIVMHTNTEGISDPYTRATIEGLFPLDAEPEEMAKHVDIHVINSALIQIYRFGGHCDRLTVQGHCTNVANIAAASGADRVTQLWALLHDAHEAYLGDMISPVGRLKGLDGRTLAEHMEPHKARIDRAICIKYGIELTDKIREDVKRYDKLATEYERCISFPAQYAKIGGSATLETHTMCYVNPAHDYFMGAFLSLIDSDIL